MRIHIYFTRPIEGKILLVGVDAYSTWAEVDVMEETTADRTVEEMVSQVGIILFKNGNR